MSGMRIQTGIGRSMESSRFRRNDWHSVQKQALVSLSAARYVLIGPEPRRSS